MPFTGFDDADEGAESGEDLFNLLLSLSLPSLYIGGSLYSV